MQVFLGLPERQTNSAVGSLAHLPVLADVASCVAVGHVAVIRPCHLAARHVVQHGLHVIADGEVAGYLLDVVELSEK